MIAVPVLQGFNRKHYTLPLGDPPSKQADHAWLDSAAPTNTTPTRAWMDRAAPTNTTPMRAWMALMPVSCAKEEPSIPAPTALPIPNLGATLHKQKKDEKQNVCNTLNHNFLPFEQAVMFAQSLGLKSKRGWEMWRKNARGERPSNIPANPLQTYKNEGWQGWGHWLGTGTESYHLRQYLPFDDAVKYVRGLKLKGQRAWEKWCRQGSRPVKFTVIKTSLHRFKRALKSGF